jgi:UPF0755 protein
MLKRFLVGFIILIAVVALAGYGVFRYRTALRQQRQSARAPEQQITIIEGWTSKDIAGMLSEKGILQPADFLQAQKNFDTGSYLALSSKPADADLEGFLFPDTYRIAVYPGASSTTIASQILEKLLNNFNAKFTPTMRRATAARGYSVYQIVTLASIIEKETGRAVTTPEQKQSLDDERKTIAGIFYNRLEAGMPLESDATVNYVTGKTDAAVLNQDTLAESPYNTYRYKGLPPGPICNPSLSSLLAAVYPNATDYFYFLHAQPSGQVVYGKTYEQHLKNKQKYLP